MVKKKQHPWRICPVGEYWVKEHPRKVTKSEKYPDGTTIVDGHCRKNSSRHEIFVADELHEIAKQYFKNIKEVPKADNLGSPKGNDFDELIGGWTKF